MNDSSVDGRTERAPIVLFNDECAVCRSIARWVYRSAARTVGSPSIVERPIGDDPAALHALNSRLSIWDAYETIHVLMPDGSMKLGGEAVAQVLRSLPNTQWFAGIFAFRCLGIRPFQLVLNLGYALLSDARPLLGCESCGTPNVWVAWLAKSIGFVESVLGLRRTPAHGPHFSRSRPNVSGRSA